MTFDVEATRAICDAATLGPWDTFEYRVHDRAGRGIAACWRPWGPITGKASIKSDAAFIAHARTALPAALDEIERLRADLRLADRALDSVGKSWEEL